MRILIATDTYYPHVNGASYFTQRLATGLAERGHTVQVVAPGQHWREERSIVNGVPLFGMPSVPVPFYRGMTVAWLFGMKKRMTKLLDEFKPEIVHVQGHFPISRTVICLANRRGIPVVGTNHFMPENLVHYFHLQRFLEKHVIRMAWKDCRKIFSKLSAVTTPTETAASLLRSPTFSKTVLPISCGIDLQRFSPANRNEALKKTYNLPLDVPLLLYVGRLDREKNVDAVLRALALVPKQVPWHFVIGGNGAEKACLMQLTNTLGLSDRVTFLGFVPNDDLPSVYALCDCFMMAGTAELQSIVTMEAMATGLPVLAVSATALPELVHDQENGFLFSLNNLPDLAQKIERLCTDASLRSAMGKKSLEIISKHSLEKSLATFEKVYTDAIHKNA